MRASGAQVLDLTESNPTKAGLDYPAAAILEAFSDARSLQYDPLPLGSPAAREAVAAHYESRGIPIDTGRILLTASTSEGYAFLFKLLANPGDEVLVPRPSYPLFEFLAGMESVRVMQYPLVYHDGWQIDFEALMAAVTDRTRAVIVVNPNNPTGSFLKGGELAALTRICRQRGLAILSDEVFSGYAIGEDAARVTSLIGAEVLTFSMSGLSKVAGLPQMKLGWIVTSGPSAECDAARENLELIADTYLSVSTPVQYALPSLLKAGEGVRRQIAERVAHNLAALDELLLGQPSMRRLRVEGGWYAVVRAPRVRSEEEWVLHLLGERDVLVQPGFFYDFESEAFLVLSLITEPGMFREGVRRLVA